MNNNMNSVANKLITKRELCERLGVCVRTVDRYRRLYDMGEIRMGGVVRFRQDTIEAAIESGGFQHRQKRRR